MIGTQIINGLGVTRSAEVNEENALKVATRPYYSYNPAVGFFQNDIHGIDLNKNFSASDGEGINNGGDDLLWTGVDIVGTSTNFADTNNPDTGTNNVSVTNASNGDTFIFDKGSDFTVGIETAIQGRLYITSVHQLSTIEITAYDADNLITVGDTVQMWDYVNISTTGTYQTFSIPLSDLDLPAGTVFDSLRFTLTKNGHTWDLDNIKFTEPGGGALGTTTFTIEPGRGTQYTVNGFNITMADAYTGAVTDGTMPSLRYDGFLGLPKLPNGMIFRIINNLDTVSFAANISEMIEFFQFGTTTFGGYGSDGTNTWMQLHLHLAAPVVLNADEKDSLELVLSDNLAGLLWFRWSLNAKQRDIF